MCGLGSGREMSRESEERKQCNARSQANEKQRMKGKIERSQCNKEMYSEDDVVVLWVVV